MFTDWQGFLTLPWCPSQPGSAGDSYEKSFIAVLTGLDQFRYGVRLRPSPVRYAAIWQVLAVDMYPATGPQREMFISRKKGNSR